MHIDCPQPVLSPCIGICHLDDSGLCVGCFRSAAEIAAWGSLSREARLALMATLPDRASLVAPRRRGGRRGRQERDGGS